MECQKSRGEKKIKKTNIATHPLSYSRKRVGFKAASQKRERDRERGTELIISRAFYAACLLF